MQITMRCRKPTNMDFPLSKELSTGRIEMITVVFQPYAVKALFHIPSHLFRGQTVDTDAMEDVELSDLVKQVTDTSDNAVCIDRTVFSSSFIHSS